MPYGDLVKQKVQRYSSLEDLKKYECTVEEMEEYEPHIVNGTIIYAGVDYEAILREAEKEADVIVWDGGNNDMSFYQPDLTIVVADPHRPGHEISYYPGAVNICLADIVIINKIDTASRENIDIVRKNIVSINPRAVIIEAASPITVEDETVIRNKRVLVVEDGPTLTHGDMTYGAGVLLPENTAQRKSSIQVRGLSILLRKLLRNIRILEHYCRQWDMAENRLRISRQQSIRSNAIRL